MRAKLVLKKLPEPSGGTDQSTERRPVEIMIVNVQPPTLVAANQCPVDHESFDKVHQRVLLQISLGVIAVIGYHVPKFLWRDAEGPQDVLENV